jgi:hypothetical protein
MAFSTKYSMLFSVKILNLFHLNKGLQEYNSMSENDKAKQIDGYNFSNFFKIQPASATNNILKGQNLICKTLNSEFSIFAKVLDTGNNIPFISIHPDLSLTFLIHIVDPKFYNYTDLKPDNAKKLYYFSNRRLSTETGTFPLINKYGDGNSIDESFVLSNDSTNTEFAELSAYDKEGLFGILRIFMRGDDSSHHVVDTLNQILIPYSTFQLRFANRKTFWRYIFLQNQTVTGSSDVKIEGVDPKILITKAKQPLTEKGFISVKHKKNELPNPGINQVIPDFTGNNYYSEIYM